MTNLPLTPGVYTLRSGKGTATITRIGKKGRWAFDGNNNHWYVETGEHSLHKNMDLVARVDPDAELARAMVDDGLILFEAFSADEVNDLHAAIDGWRHEVGKLHSQLDRSTADFARVSQELAKAKAELDEAVGLLDDVYADNGSEFDLARAKLVAKIGVK